MNDTLRIIKQPGATTSHAADTIAALNIHFGAQNMTLLRRMALAEHLNDGSAQKLQEQNFVVSTMLVKYMQENGLIASVQATDVNRLSRRKLVEIFVKG